MHFGTQCLSHLKHVVFIVSRKKYCNCSGKYLGTPSKLIRPCTNFIVGHSVGSVLAKFFKDPDDLIIPASSNSLSCKHKKELQKV